MKRSQMVIAALLLGWAWLFVQGCKTEDRENTQDLGLDAAVDSKTNDLETDGAYDQGGDQSIDGKVDSMSQTEIPNAFGFMMRNPKNRKLQCPKAIDPNNKEKEFPDVDWICTYSYENTQGHIYVQNTPIKCESLGMFDGPVYQTTGAFISLQGQVTALANASYDFGGNHANDFMGFDYGGKYVEYNHSSFGVGYRKCQPMDCLKIFKAKNAELIKDGCVPEERALPVVCLEVTAGETYDESKFTDTFQPCPQLPKD